jgi:hydrophobic/amphiphilic exporter-1 (mainly G- bacteria), HAE1 family
VLASTLTTVSVFLPVIFMREEAGQLFRDIAIAITFAIGLSLLVSVLVIPMLSRQLFRLIREDALSERIRRSIGSVGSAVGAVIMAGVERRRAARPPAGHGGAVHAVSVSLAILLFPKMEYLPQGNRNLVLNLLIPPPGLSFDERKAIGEQIYRGIEPHVGTEKDGLPGIKTMFYIGAEGFMLFGAISTHEQRAGELIPLFQRAIRSIPGLLGVSLQAGVFQTSLGRGRTIEVDVSGEDLNRLVQAAGMLFGEIMGAVPGSQIRPVPSLELLFPEVRLIPDRDRLRALGMSARDFGLIVDVLMDGRDIGDYKQDGQKKIELRLMGSETDIDTPEALYSAPVAVPGGKVVPLSSLAAWSGPTGSPRCAISSASGRSPCR